MLDQHTNEKVRVDEIVIIDNTWWQ